MCPCEDVDERGWISVGEVLRLCGFGVMVVEWFDASWAGLIFFVLSPALGFMYKMGRLT